MVRLRPRLWPVDRYEACDLAGGGIDGESFDDADGGSGVVDAGTGEGALDRRGDRLRVERRGRHDVDVDGQLIAAGSSSNTFDNQPAALPPSTGRASRPVARAMVTSLTLAELPTIQEDEQDRNKTEAILPTRRNSA